MVRVWGAGAVLAAAGGILAVGAGEDRAGLERGAEIAFTSNQGGKVSVMLAAGDGRRRVRVRRGASAPAWSPDGQRLAFVRERDEDSDIAVMDPDGSGARVVTSGAGRDRYPAFSPDGQWIAFTRHTGGDGGPPRAAIHVVRTDGSGLRPLTSGDDIAGQPAWSPDGSRLAFARATAGGHGFDTHIHVQDLATGGERRLVEGHSPAWSPDGSRIAYVSGRDRFGRTCFHECTPSGEIYVVNTAGRDDRRLTRSRADDDDPAWVAGGRQLVFSSDRSDPDRHDRELYAMTAAGECITRLTNASSWSGDPAWRPGGIGRLPCEPGGVAAGARRGLVDVDLRPVRGFSAYPLFWLGRRHRGLMLTHAQHVDDGFTEEVFFAYGDCESPRRTRCPPADVQMQNRRLCWWRESPAPVRLRRIGHERGAPIYAIGSHTGDRTGTEVHTGETAVRVQVGDGGDLRRALAALRPLDGDPGRRLPPPARRCD